MLITRAGNLNLSKDLSNSRRIIITRCGTSEVKKLITRVSIGIIIFQDLSAHRWYCLLEHSRHGIWHTHFVSSNNSMAYQCHSKRFSWSGFGQITIQLLGSLQRLRYSNRAVSTIEQSVRHLWASVTKITLCIANFNQNCSVVPSSISYRELVHSFHSL